MLCPSCKVELKIADRQGIEIDYCPQCRGIWLDRGELDKIVERSLTIGQPAQSAPHQREQVPYGYRQPDDDDDDYRRPGYQGQRRRGWLGDLFDFD